MQSAARGHLQAVPKWGIALPRPVVSLFAVALCTSVAMGLAVRLVDIASVPPWHSDEGLWAMPPRDFVLFSRWTLGSYYHHYLSPLFTGLLTLEFWVLGPGIVQARILNAFAGVLTAIGVGLLGRRLGSPTAGALAALALAVDGPSIITSRSVLLESLQGLLLVGLACQAVGTGRWRRPGLALLIGLAALTKLLSLYAVAPITLYSLWKRGWRGALLDGLWLSAGVLLAGSVFGVIALADWDNFGSVWRWEFTTRTMGRAMGMLGSEGSLRDTAIYFLTRSPVLLLALLCASILALIRRWLTNAASFVGLWVVVGAAVMTVQGYSPQRYYVPLIPLTWLLVFLVLRDAPPRGALTDWGPRLACVLLLVHTLFSLTSLFGYYYVLERRDESPAALAQWVDQNVRPGERVLGPFNLVVSTRAQALGLESVSKRGPLTPADLDALGVAYVIVRHDTGPDPLSSNLKIEEDNQDRYRLVAQFRDIRVYRISHSQD